MRDTLRGLTMRGRVVLGAGAALVVIAWLLGQRDLLRVGVLALALTLLSAFLVARTRFRLTCARGVGSARITVGGNTVSVISGDGGPVHTYRADSIAKQDMLKKIKVGDVVIGLTTPLMITAISPAN